MSSRCRLLVFIVAYNAEKTIEPVLDRIPDSLRDCYDVEILIIDDQSHDDTFGTSVRYRAMRDRGFPLHILYNPVNQGYGGNQKVGFQFAIRQGFDVVALVHGDGQYAPECLPELVGPAAAGDADAVFGSRMMRKGAARAGGMPLYKFVGNRILTTCQNRLLGTALTEFHSGYRIYRVDALAALPFALNTNDFHFDTEIIIQLVNGRKRILELPIPTYYGDEICHVNGWKYAADVMVQTLRARAVRINLFYDPRFDVTTAPNNQGYRPKLDYPSPHKFALDTIPAGARVVDLGCGGGYVAEAIRTKGCHVVGVDAGPLDPSVELDGFFQFDLNHGLPSDLDLADFDYVLALDVIEHLASPEAFVEALARQLGRSPDTRLIASTANVGFILTRLGLLVGSFNYGKRGILDLTHTRLFTFATFRALFAQRGFAVHRTAAAPVPFALAVGSGRLARVLSAINRGFIALRRSVFAFQSIYVLSARPSLDYLLAVAEEASRAKVAAHDAALERAAE